MLSNDRYLRHFQVLVLCAKEIQPSVAYFPRHLTIIRCPLKDDRDPIMPAERQLIRRTAQLVARQVARGRRCLVTCQAGLNRSGIVTATALHYLTGRSGKTCAATVARYREGALFNEVFVAELYRLKSQRSESYA